MINVGANLVAGIEELLQVAVIQQPGGADKWWWFCIISGSSGQMAFANLPDAVVSSRDALHVALCLNAMVSLPTVPDVIGCLGAVITPLPETIFWPMAEQKIFGTKQVPLRWVIDWTTRIRLVLRLTAPPRPVFVANPDAAPQTGIFHQSRLLDGPGHAGGKEVSAWIDSALVRRHTVSFRSCDGKAEQTTRPLIAAGWRWLVTPISWVVVRLVCNRF